MSTHAQKNKNSIVTKTDKQTTVTANKAEWTSSSPLNYAKTFDYKHALEALNPRVFGPQQSLNFTGKSYE